MTHFQYKTVLFSFISTLYCFKSLLQSVCERDFLNCWKKFYLEFLEIWRNSRRVLGKRSSPSRSFAQSRACSTEVYFEILGKNLVNKFD